MDSSHLSLIDEASNALIKYPKSKFEDNHLNKVEELVLQLAQEPSSYIYLNQQLLMINIQCLLKTMLNMIYLFWYPYY